MSNKKSFFERITGSMKMSDEDESDVEAIYGNSKKLNIIEKENPSTHNHNEISENNWDEEAELTCDLYDTPNEIIVQTMVAGVSPENLSINITRDSITIRGKREDTRSGSSINFFIQELYWGSFARKIDLPDEIDPDQCEAIEKHGLLIVKMPKIDKNRETKVKIKSI